MATTSLGLYLKLTDGVPVSRNEVYALPPNDSIQPPALRAAADADRSAHGAARGPGEPRSRRGRVSDIRHQLLAQGVAGACPLAGLSHPPMAGFEVFTEVGGGVRASRQARGTT
jgi:hypothetical protein